MNRPWHLVAHPPASKAISAPLNLAARLLSLRFLLPLALAGIHGFSPMAIAQKEGVLLQEFQPRSMLKTPQTLIQRSKFPAIDIHGHLGRMDPDEAIEVMNDCNIRVIVDFDGRWGPFLERQKQRYQAWPGRVVHFTRLPWGKINEPDFSKIAVEQLREAVKAGAKGLKISKALGLYVRENNGQLLRVNDPRLDPVWKECGKLKIPVAIHTADPDAFFLPLDRFNEQIKSLTRNPAWHFHGKDFPSKDELLEQRNDIIARHPETIFIGLHGANRSENLAQVSEWLDRFPNLYVEFGARVNEIGRQPYTARKFFIKNADRILFGVDRGSMTRYHYRVYFRFLETQDEYFPFGGNLGHWNIYGIYLPDDVLEKIYYKNAMKLLNLSSLPKQS